MTYKTMTITDIKIDIMTAYLRLRGAADDVAGKLSESNWRDAF